jgi:hypothetical protein
MSTRMADKSAADQYLSGIGANARKPIETKAVGVPANWKDLEYHPLSNLVEFGAGIDLDGLRKHMRENGYDLDEPIILYSGKILDGRHKHASARAENVTPTFREFVGASPEAYVIKKAYRQHLNESQRALIAAGIAENRSNAQICAGEQPEKRKQQSQAAKVMNVGERTVQQATKVKDKGTPEVAKAVADGTLPVDQAAKIVDEPPKVQNQAIKDVREGKAKIATAPTSKDGRITKTIDRLDRLLAERECKTCCEGLAGLRDHWAKCAGVPSKPKGKFRKPTVEEVLAYCQERGNSVNPQKFVDFYESKGWKVGKTPMKDWKACVRSTWEKDDKGKTKHSGVNAFSG